MKKYTFIVLAFLIASLLLYLRFSDFRKAGNDNLKTISPVPANPEGSNVPDSWKVYVSDTLDYSISYPENLVVEPNGDYSILITKELQEPSFGPANFIYVSVVPPDQITNEGEIYNFNQVQFNKLQKLEIGESVSLADTDQPNLNDWFTYTRVDNTVIDNQTTKRFENIKPWEFPTGTSEVRFVFESGGNIYLMGYYYGGEGVKETIDPFEAFRVISSFRLN